MEYCFAVAGVWKKPKNLKTKTKTITSTATYGSRRQKETRDGWPQIWRAAARRGEQVWVRSGLIGDWESGGDSGLREKTVYTKLRNCDVRKIYHRYPLIFGQAFDLDKYAITPTKLSQRGFDGVINSGSDSPRDTLSIFVETRDSSDEGPVALVSSSRMDISGCHSREKQKGSDHRTKEKVKKIGSVDLSYSVEHLATVGEALAASRQNYQEQVPSYHQCITELVATGKVPKGSALYNFTLTFLVNRKNQEDFTATEEPEYKLGLDLV
ncbi:Uncharacterized protein Adt_45724 [Abeliophyllum distichum]|uniref:Uncharacterized protein n=1 Tax=Abeliophyllum distichum TaxID=126358 RepID=A0ABD1PEH0_9LAMI